MSFDDRFSPMRNASQSSVTPAEVGSLMSGVYAWMTLGLGLTAFTGYMVTLSPQILSLIFGTPGAFIGIVILQLAIVMVLSWLQNKISPVVATMLYLLYSLVNGLAFSVYFLIYQLDSMATVFGITAMTFGTMALFGYVTKKDLSGLGLFFMMSLVGLIIASVVNMFIHSSGLDFAISVFGVIIFAGLTAFDVQRIKQMAYYQLEQGGGVQKMMILGALKLYLDFLNMFLFLLRIMGGGSRR